MRIIEFSVAGCRFPHQIPLVQRNPFRFNPRDIHGPIQHRRTA